MLERGKDSNYRLASNQNAKPIDTLPWLILFALHDLTVHLPERRIQLNV